jgi:hypothetical protein
MWALTLVRPHGHLMTLRMNGVNITRQSPPSGLSPRTPYGWLDISSSLLIPSKGFIVGLVSKKKYTKNVSKNLGPTGPS